jgi:hypothetical protein
MLFKETENIYSRFEIPLFVLICAEATQTDAKARDTLIEMRDLLVTPNLIAFIESIDRLTSLCCLILSEIPPAPQVYQSLNLFYYLVGSIVGWGCQ